MKTDLALEKYSSFIFTINVFHDLQKEFYASIYSCNLVNVDKHDDVEVYEVQSSNGKSHHVNHSTADCTFECTCKLFNNIGLPCRHLILVFKSKGMEEFPSGFVKTRWTKAASLNPRFEIDGVLYENGVLVEEKKKAMNELVGEMHRCLNAVYGDVEASKNFQSLIKAGTDEYISTSGRKSGSSSKQRAFEKYVGSRPSAVDVLPPPPAKNKGSGKRVVGALEKQMGQASKQRRSCTTCGRYGHNSRTCSQVALSQPDDDNSVL